MPSLFDFMLAHQAQQASFYQQQQESIRKENNDNAQRDRDYWSKQISGDFDRRLKLVELQSKMAGALGQPAPTPTDSRFDPGFNEAITPNYMAGQVDKEKGDSAEAFKRYIQDQINARTAATLENKTTNSGIIAGEKGAEAKQKLPIEQQKADASTLISRADWLKAQADKEKADKTGAKEDKQQAAIDKAVIRSVRAIKKLRQNYDTYGSVPKSSAAVAAMAENKLLRAELKQNFNTIGVKPGVFRQFEGKTAEDVIPNPQSATGLVSEDSIHGGLDALESAFKQAHSGYNPETNDIGGSAVAQSVQQAQSGTSASNSSGPTLDELMAKYHGH